MTQLQEFKAFALGNMMAVEQIVADICAASTRGKTDFALFDGGAHKAFHTLRMLSLPGCARVYAVEADPFMARTCRARLAEKRPRAQDRIVFVEAALQDDPAVERIAWKSSPSHQGRSSILSGNAERPTIWTGNADMAYRDEMSVAATTIDRILADEPRALPFLKLDLEGADLLALTGAAVTLRDKRPVVAFENSVHAPAVHGFTLEGIAAYFEGLDYVPMNFVGERIAPRNWFGFFEAWAAPRDRADWLSDRLRDRVAHHMG